MDSPRANLVEREAVSIVVNENWDCEENGKNAKFGMCTRVCRVQISRHEYQTKRKEEGNNKAQGRQTRSDDVLEDELEDLQWDIG